MWGTCCPNLDMEEYRQEMPLAVNRKSKMAKQLGPEIHGTVQYFST